MEIQEQIENMNVCPKCNRDRMMRIHINSDWVNGPSCILEADGCYCTYADCDFVFGEGPWMEAARCWNSREKTWKNQYGQTAYGTCRID